MITIARVFPTKTSMSPDDPHAYFGNPPFGTYYDEVHISVAFTWDIPKAKALYRQWAGCCKAIKMNGPACDNRGENFTSGLYLKKGITITSRGCPNKCSFCLVNKREGRIRELPIVEGNIIQDNNILACSKSHIDKVFEMLKSQRQIEFKGGLEARLITPEIADRLRGLKIMSLWLACDTPSALKGTLKAINILKKAGFNRNKIYSYVLIGKDMIEEEYRMRELFVAGAMPFAQLYRNETDGISYSKEYHNFQREWSRPAIIKAHFKTTKEKCTLF